MGDDTTGLDAAIARDAVLRDRERCDSLGLLAEAERQARYASVRGDYALAYIYAAQRQALLEDDSAWEV